MACCASAAWEPVCMAGEQRRLHALSAVHVLHGDREQTAPTVMTSVMPGFRGPFELEVRHAMLRVRRQPQARHLHGSGAVHTSHRRTICGCGCQAWAVSCRSPAWASLAAAVYNSAPTPACAGWCTLPSAPAQHMPSGEMPPARCCHTRQLLICNPGTAPGARAARMRGHPVMVHHEDAL